VTFLHVAKTLGRTVVGAFWGLGAAGLLSPHFPQHATTLFVLGAAAGVLFGLRCPRAKALEHSLAATLAAGCGLSMLVMPEPTVFLLVPLLAAAVAWPLGPAEESAETLPRGAIVASFAFAAGAFFLQSARRHWQFGSGSDLALFFQHIWLSAFGHVPYNTIMDMHMLADHLTFVDFLVAPLLHVHRGPETLLFVQSLVVASAAFPLFFLARQLLGSERSALFFAWGWLLSYEVHMGVMFEYNPSTMGSAMLCWTAWALVCRGPVAVLLTSLLAMACKEDFAPYVATIAAVLVLVRAIRWPRGALVALFALAFFYAGIGVIVPMFREGGFRHWEFPELGGSSTEIASSVLRHPFHAAALLVDDPLKRRSLLLPLATTGFIGLAEPASLLLQVPNWAERLLSSHGNRWWGYYYGMPATATALLGLLLGWRRLREYGLASPATARYALGCATLLAVFPPYPSPGGNPRSDLLVARQPYASTPEDIATQQAAVRFIGRDPWLKVAAQYHLLSHLAGRVFIVPLSRAGEADVVALQIDGGTHPGGRAAWHRDVREVWSTGAFRVAFCDGRSVVLRRRGGQSVPCPSWEALEKTL
jgi:uncharacterized membrane protein